ncbi:hypothetical protein OUZ56_032367 [Daphnia magna]|uniref:Uncharacterized protein n=1 Tax=Daphnia magna TaxID=35525 RepID=A0ABR0B8P0_9CRUS|nr:hypothetical protein OUZ56_032367 [Daphnia magna]
MGEDVLRLLRQELRGRNTSRSAELIEDAGLGGFELRGEALLGLRFAKHGEVRGEPRRISLSRLETTPREKGRHRQVLLPVLGVCSFDERVTSRHDEPELFRGPLGLRRHIAWLRTRAGPPRGAGSGSASGAVDALVAARRAIPGAIEAHDATTDVGEAGADERSEGAVGGAVERFRFAGGEEEAGAGLQGGIAVDDGVDEAASTMGDRQRAVAGRILLNEAARLVARRDEGEVGAGKNPVDLGFGGAAKERDPRRVLFGEGGQGVGEDVLPFPGEHELGLGACQKLRQHRVNEVDPLLGHEATDEAKQRQILPLDQTEFLLEGRLAAPLRRSILGVETGGDCAVGRRVPDGVVDAVEDRRSLRSSFQKDRLEPEAALLRQELARIGRADGRDGIRMEDAELEEVEAAMKFNAVRGKELGIDPDLFEGRLREDPLMSGVVNRENALRLRERRLLRLQGAQEGRYEGGRPVVDVDGVDGSSAGGADLGNFGNCPRKQRKERGSPRGCIAVDRVAGERRREVEEEEIDLGREAPVVGGDGDLGAVPKEGDRRQTARKKQAGLFVGGELGRDDRHPVTGGAERFRERGSHIGEPADLHVRKKLGHGEKEVHRRRLLPHVGGATNAERGIGAQLHVAHQRARPSRTAPRRRPRFRRHRLSRSPGERRAPPRPFHARATPAHEPHADPIHHRQFRL